MADNYSVTPRRHSIFNLGRMGLQSLIWSYVQRNTSSNILLVAYLWTISEVLINDIIHWRLLFRLNWSQVSLNPIMTFTGLENGLCLLEKSYPGTNIHQIKVSLPLLWLLSLFPMQTRSDPVYPKHMMHNSAENFPKAFPLTQNKSQSY